MLYDYGITRNGATLDLLPTRPLRLTITTTSGGSNSKILIYILGTATVAELKERVAAHTGVPAVAQRLVFEGEELGESEAAWLEEEEEEDERVEKRERRGYKMLWELGLRDRAALMLLPTAGTRECTCMVWLVYYKCTWCLPGVVALAHGLTR